MTSTSQKERKEQSRAGRSGRAEWNALLATVMLLVALPASLPGSLSGASGAAGNGVPLWSRVAALTVSPAHRSAVLWWLQTSATTAVSSAPESATKSPLSPTEVQALLERETAFSTQAAAGTITGHERLTDLDASSAGTSEFYAPLAVPTHADLLRYDATRHLARHSLSAHEAGFRSGARVNRYLE